MHSMGDEVYEGVPSRATQHPRDAPFKINVRLPNSYLNNAYGNNVGA